MKNSVFLGLLRTRHVLRDVRQAVRPQPANWANWA